MPPADETPWIVEFYRDRRGRTPAEEFLDSLTNEENAEALRLLQLLREHGIQLSMPQARPNARRLARAAVAEPPIAPGEDADFSPTVPFEEIEARLLADPAIRAAYDALEPAYQIASLRIQAGLTQAQLAQLVGTKQPSIARLERGRQQPTLEFLRKLGAALGYRLEINFVPLTAPAEPDPLP